MSLFSLRAANLGYGGAPVLTDVSLDIDAGERVAVVGPSGAGKSTLLSALYQQQKGQIALVPQDGALVKQLSVYHNVYVGRLHRHGTVHNLANLIRPLRAPVAAVTAILEELDMTDKLFTPVGELSGGQQQRTAVARALYHGGEVLLGDEPVSAVDGVQARDVLAAINRACRTVVLVMHDIKLALELVTRVIGIRRGRIIFDRRASDLAAGDLDSLYR
ncbi:MAG TPA: ATP-binding cassette domain-containing protein [Polyangia bacterium]|jgi:phosphonate transport system ATP-binding protein|nr:ATP-binding cassette domain-containing protein [Polyangia bacterium]